MNKPYPGFLDAILKFPAAVSNWGKAFENRIIERTNRRLEVLKDRTEGVVSGRTIPELQELALGSGSYSRLAIMFLDVCGFSDMPNWSREEQKHVLAVMNLFMSEMIAIVRDFGGHFEKNTGDGLMAYFGEGMATDQDRVKPAVEAAVVMHYFNDHLLGPYFDQANVPRVRFRIGIDVGPVTLARIGVKSSSQGYNSIVAIGTTANVACKLMKLIPEGGICVGDFAYAALPSNWWTTCTPCGLTTFVYLATQQKYGGWNLRHRLSRPLL